MAIDRYCLCISPTEKLTTHFPASFITMLMVHLIVTMSKYNNTLWAQYMSKIIDGATNAARLVIHVANPTRMCSDITLKSRFHYGKYIHMVNQYTPIVPLALVNNKTYMANKLTQGNYLSS